MFDRKGRSLLVLNADSTLEIFKVNVDKPEAILKKLVRAAKKNTGILGKRAHAQMEEENSNVKVDKEAIEQQIADRTYDLAVHFSRKIKVELDLN